MIVSVHCALGTFGFLKSGTALLTASTPVIAVQPLANERNISHILAASIACGAGGGCPPLSNICTIPIVSAVPTHATKPMTGKENAMPDCLTPRRFMRVNVRRPTRHRANLWEYSAGIADSTAATPAEIATPTLST